MTGSYKERGAMNRLARLSPEERSRGIVCSSAGNHAQAVAYHAMRLGISAKICMPENTPLSKIAGTERWGPEIILKGKGFDEAFREASRY